jgi:type II secretory pathway predicted ATPase ExeA
MDDSTLPLRERPFPAAPCPAACFPTESFEQARRQVARCIDRAEGAALVVGGAGMGKSLLLQLLAEQFRSRFHVALLSSLGSGNRRTLLQNILFELGLAYRGLDEGELRLALREHLQPSRECPHGMLLLIDEAHAMPLRLLEDVRLLTNLVHAGSPRIRLVLAGSPALEERFASPKLASLNQRIAVRAYLQAMTSAETAAYIQHELARCGGQIELFAPEALRAVHTAADGVPRLINQVCDHAMILASAHRRGAIDAACVQEAWSELQQLPTPWQQTPATASSIEFGTLEELVDEEIADEASSPDESIDAVDEKGRPAVDERMPHEVPSAAELFGDDFTEEELVVDRSPGGKEPARAPVVADQGGPVAEAAADDCEPIVTAPLPGSSVEFDPALDPVYPEPAVVPAQPGRTTHQTATKSVFIDGGHSVPEPHAPATAGSIRFRDLLPSWRRQK